jgi:hypothetical protein
MDVQQNVRYAKERLSVADNLAETSILQRGPKDMSSYLRIGFFFQHSIKLLSNMNSLHKTTPLSYVENIKSGRGKSGKCAFAKTGKKTFQM